MSAHAKRYCVWRVALDVMRRVTVMSTQQNTQLQLLQQKQEQHEQEQQKEQHLRAASEV